MRFVTRKALSRRTVLRGLGTTLALPYLDSMVPALGAAPTPPNRFGVVYVPNGIMMENWTPASEGPFTFTPILKPIERFGSQVLVLSGLNSAPPAALAHLPGNHGRASTRFLTDIPPKPTLAFDLEAGVSVDQIIARGVSGRTPVASLELGLDSSNTPGGGDPGYSRAYTSTISWRSATTPLPTENNPRAVFERLFGDNSTTDPAARQARIRHQHSVLDAVNGKLGRLQREIGAEDRAKLEQFTEALRDVERRMQVNEANPPRDLPVFEPPPGIPATFAEHMNSMFDLWLLASQTDLCRVITFMVAREFSGRTYPELGVHDSHHPLSHHQNYPDRLRDLVKINTYHMELFAGLLEKLKRTADGDGSLLDHSIILYGAGMSDGNSHSPYDLPLLIAGAHPQAQGVRHIKYPKGTPLANLHLTLMDRFGVHVDKIGDSTGEVKI